MVNNDKIVIAPKGRITFGELMRPNPHLGGKGEMVLLSNPPCESTYRTEFKLQPYQAEAVEAIREIMGQTYEAYQRVMDKTIAAALLIPARRFGKTVTSTTAAETAIKMDEMRKKLEALNNTQIPRILYSEHASKPTSERLFPFSRHRSWRIEKKLTKRFGGVYRHEPAIYQMGGLIIAHPSFRAEIEAKLSEVTA